VDIGGCRTHGPKFRYGAVLFVEKEGFDPLLWRAQFAQRYDTAPMSTKGMSVTAARMLVDEICGETVPLLVLHDFDKAAFSISGTLSRDTRRYSFNNQPNIIDLGLRLTDVQELGLESEQVFDRGNERTRRQNLRLNGATPEEIEFLLHRRVELNAMSSDQLVAFIERKLQEHGVLKIIPDAEILARQYRVTIRGMEIKRKFEEMLAQMPVDNFDVPDDLAAKVVNLLKEQPHTSWDQAIAKIVEGIK
jgi:hypothetical protein